jgi:phosphoadenosine phosphosulfate reductase
MKNLENILTETKNLSWQEKLIFVAKNFSEVVFSTSFSIEDQVILDFIAKNKLDIEVFTLDTGRLNEETYATWQNSLERYKIKISPFYPNAEKLQEFIFKKGINAFYESKELRLSCCEIRKVEPLSRALKGKKVWISGVRKEQSLARLDKEFFERDEKFDLVKFYPLLDLKESEIWQIIDEKKIPFNRLYKQGYSSIGCAPCSRAIKEGEDLRAGRWWWESDSKKECGLHLNLSKDKFKEN